jgi:hypothetical protein
MRHRVDRPEVVDSDEVDVGPHRLRRPEEVAADAPEPVDAHTYCHGE